MVNPSPHPPKVSSHSHLVAAHTLQGGLFSSPRAGNVSFNDQGQGVLLSGREVVVFTPHQPSKFRSSLPPPPPTLPLILDDTSLSIPTLPPTHSILPLHLTRTSIIPFPWDGYRPPPNYGWDFDGPSAKRLLEDELADQYKSSLQSDSTEYATPGWTEGGGPTDLNAFQTSVQSTPMTREVAWSPSGMGYRDGSGGCVMAVLDTRLNVTIRSAKDVVDGDWAVLGDLTRETYLLSSPSSSSTLPPPPKKSKISIKGKGKDTNPIEVDTPPTTPATSEIGDVQGKSKQKVKGKGKEVDRNGNGNVNDMRDDADLDRPGRKTGLQREMELQVMCIAWSSSPRFGKPFGTRPHASLLALGSRSGEIALWSMQELKIRPIGQSGMKRLFVKQVTKSWITHMFWSDWEQVNGDTNTARLAFATPDGSVSGLKVSRKIDPMTEKVDLVVGKPVILLKKDGRPVTGMKWVHNCWIVAKVGIVHVLSTRGDSIKPSKIMLKRRGAWAGCTAYSPCTGICSFPYNSALVALSSGELHLIRNLAGEPYIDDSASTELMLAHRKSLADADQSKSTDDMTVRLQGFEGLHCDLVGGSFVFASIHEPLNMHDLTSPREGSRSYHVSVVDFAGLVKPPQDQADDGMTGVKETKSHTHLVVASLTSFLPSIYRAKLNMSNDVITALPFHPITPSASSEASFAATARSTFRSNLQWELLESPESKLVHAKAIWATWNAAADVNVQLERANLDRSLSPEDRMARVLRSIILWLSRSTGSSEAPRFSTQDSVLVQRVITASELYTSVKTDFDVAAVLNIIQHSLTAFNEIVVDDRCVFCHEVLPLVGFDLGRLTQSCSLGHVWSRCSLTMQIITTPTIRSCSVCHLKALPPRVPAEDQDNTAATGDYRTQDLLMAASRCVACGGSWRRLI